MSAYRDELAAAHARIAALEEERAPVRASEPWHDDMRTLRVIVTLLMVAAVLVVALFVWCLLT